MDGHFTYVDTNSQTINAPTMIRTGTGSIDVAAANDVSLFNPSSGDPTASIVPGVIYTAGAPAAGAPPVGQSDGILLGARPSGGYDLMVTSAVNPDGGGDILIHAQNDITGVENVNGTGNANSQFWWQWMQTGNVVNSSNEITQTSINFGAFDQGVMSVGGNVSISAGGNITNLAVSLPTTWYLSDNNTVVNTVGGGNLTVTAGGNILSGDYFVANGTGTLTAGGRIGSSGLLTTDQFGNLDVEVSMLLAAQNGVFNVSARQGVDIGGIVDPSYLQDSTLTAAYGGLHADSQSYSANSALNVVSTTGNVAFNTLSNLGLIGAGTPGEAGQNDDSEILPATVSLTAFTGSIVIARNGELFPSATGELSLIADQSINVYNASADSSNFFGLIDAVANETATSALPSPLNAVLSSIKRRVQRIRRRPDVQCPD